MSFFYYFVFYCTCISIFLPSVYLLDRFIAYLYLFVLFYFPFISFFSLFPLYILFRYFSHFSSTFLSFIRSFTSSPFLLSSPSLLFPFSLLIPSPPSRCLQSDLTCPWEEALWGPLSSDLTLRPLRLVRKGCPLVGGLDWLKGMEEEQEGEGKRRLK